MSLLSDRDYKLSMKIGRRSKMRVRDDDTLRTLLVHRLRDSAKAVLRMRLKADVAVASTYGILCEPCGKWNYVKGAPEEFECPSCERLYVIEFAVFAEIKKKNQNDQGTA